MITATIGLINLLAPVPGSDPKKLGDDPANPRSIVNEPGVGYRLET